MDEVVRGGGEGVEVVVGRGLAQLLGGITRVIAELPLLEGIL